MFTILFLVIIYREPIQKFIFKKFLFNEQIIIQDKNEYYLANFFDYVNETDDFNIKNKQHLKDAIYTFLNNGWNNFDFYCDYSNCNDDINELLKYNDYMTLNNFVHPFNSYSRLYISINSFGKVSLNIDKTYSDNDITIVNQKLDEIISSIITDDMNDRDKIKAFHDYIINSTKYDSEYINNNLNDIHNASHKAIGPLVYNRSLCGGYTDSMAIFLDRMNIPNYKISTNEHIWNLVYIDGQWLHLDLTWDDPVTKNGTDMILYTFFLITSEQLEKLNTGFHNYDKTIFTEAN